ncbi:MAG TPA: MMPL family transporter [Cytophagaceae bacterium]|jgi:predicted RND superfamily exporter protein|nr:MMPL family transporter [Cytophagaceae bacterium]
MWYKISSIVIKNRLVFLLATLFISMYMGWQCRKLDISYDFVQIVPEDDPEYIYYRNFKKTFGEDGSIFAMGMQDKSIYTLEKFSKLQKLCADLKKIEGVKDVISLPTLKNLIKDTTNKKFDQQVIFPENIRDQKQLDSLLKEAKNVKVYDKLLVNEHTDALLIAVSLETKYLNSSTRTKVMETILNKAKTFSDETNIQLHYAGLPYIRTIMVKDMKSELVTLLCLSVLVTSGILFLFFRSFSSVVFTFLVIITTVICTGGTIVLLGYKITILTGILPALIIIISIPNCIYMYNKYHQEYKRHKNKIKAVSRIIEKIGFLTFMTNINTAVGFFVLYFTNIVTIKQFGLVAGILSVATFLITLIIIPTFLLFLPPPTAKQLKHLDLGFLRRINQILETATLRHRPWIYTITGILIVISFFGISKLKPISYMVDDLPERSTIRTDLAFFEQHFNGVMPLEIIVDLGKKKAVLRLSNLQKLEKLEKYLLEFNNISPPLSILNVVKGATQAFYGGDPEFYRLPTNNERAFIIKYFGSKEQQNSLLRSFVDSTGRYVRFTCKVADVGTIKMNELVQENIQKKADEIFSKKEGYEVKVTGTTLLFLKGNTYLIDDLSISLVYSFILISLMMAFIFTSPKMILISMIPNVIPMVITAGIMGLFHIPLKPSTALIFGISFGISIDSTIHFLSKYKQEMVFCKGNVLMAVTRSMQEAGVSMIYTSVVLFCGFIIFVFSNFGATIALGLLTSLTLFFAMFTNLTILPALLLTFSKGEHKVPLNFSGNTKKKIRESSGPLSENKGGNL